MNNKSELSVKRDEWFSSVEGKTGLSKDILRFDSYSNLLKNRLEAAFFAGTKAQEEIDSNSIAICELIDALTSDEGDSLTILSENPEYIKPENKKAVDCGGLWNDFNEDRFYGLSLVSALELAAKERQRRIQK